MNKTLVVVVMHHTIRQRAVGFFHPVGSHIRSSKSFNFRLGQRRAWTFSREPEKKWVIQFQATHNNLAGTVKSGAFGDTFEEAVEYVKKRFDGMYDTMTDFVELFQSD